MRLGEWPVRQARPRKVSPTGNLVELLSQRVLEVLHFIALGMTKPECRPVVFPPGTVKANPANIYPNLAVANRTKAVAPARQLGVLLSPKYLSRVNPENKPRIFLLADAGCLAAR